MFKASVQHETSFFNVHNQNSLTSCIFEFIKLLKFVDEWVNVQGRESFQGTNPFPHLLAYPSTSAFFPTSLLLFILLYCLPELQTSQTNLFSCSPHSTIAPTYISGSFPKENFLPRNNLGINAICS